METQSDSDRAISRHEYYDDYWSGAMGRKAEPGMDPDMPGWLNELIWPGTVVLDVGCGDGSRYTDYLISAGAKVNGFDVSDFAVRAARKRGIEAQVANLDRSLPAADEAFDSAVCIEVLEHLVEPEFTAKEIYRMLKPGGSLLVTVPNVGFWGVRMELLLTGHFDPRGCTVTRDRYPWRDPHLRFFNSSSLRNMLLDTGFVIKKQGGLETQFLEFAGLERFFRYKVTRPTQPILRHIGSRFYTVLAQRCVILAQKPVKRTSVHGSHG